MTPAHRLEELYLEKAAGRCFLRADRPEDAIAMMERLVPRLGASGQPVARNFAAFLDKKPAAQAIWSAVFSLMRQIGLDRLEPFLAEMDAEHHARLAPRLADALRQARQSGDKTVLFVATSPYFVILREAMQLRKLGWRCLLLTLEGVPGHLAETFAAHFDFVDDTRHSAPLLGTLLRQADADLVHVQCWMWAYWLGRMTLEASRAPVICEFYDVTSIYAGRDALCRLWPAETVDLDLTLERYILTHADGVVHRFPPRSVERWARRMRAMPPNVEMHGFACPEFIRCRADPALSDGPIRLIYAGGLIPQDEQHPGELFPERRQPQTFANLLRQGLEVDVFHNPHRNVDGPDLAAFRDLARRYPGFHLRPGVRPDVLPEALAPYDFGLILTEMDRGALLLSDEMMDGGVGTKLFAYLEAGLPVVVNAEYHEMARIVTENGLGLAVSSAEIGRLGEMLRRYDRAAAVERIKAFNRDHGMDRKIHDLVDLYHQASESFRAGLSRRTIRPT